MIARKGNKVYTINKSQKAGYMSDGYDIYSDEGKLIAYGSGKTVSYADYIAVKEENDKLKARLAAAPVKAAAGGRKKAGV